MVRKWHTKPKQDHKHVCKINESSNNQGQLIRDKKAAIKNPTLQPQDEQGWLEDEE